jgi:CHAD domain-containing protein
MDMRARRQDPSAPLNMPQFLLALIDRHWDKYKCEVSLCREQFSNEAIRGLRIASRRMLALVQLLRMLNLGPNLQNLRCVLKYQMDGFDNLRDIQVVLAEISGTVQEIPSLLPFRKYLQKSEKRLLRSVKKKFKQMKPGNTAKRIVKRSELLEARIIENIPGRILQAVDEAFLITRQRLGRVDPSNPDTIHSVRLGFKKFRYLVEMIHPILENFPQENLELMKNYQGAMGAIQDLEILLRTLADYAASAYAFDPKPALRFYEKHHTETIAAYLDEMDALNTFWRTTPDRPFPWEDVP